MDKFTQFSQRCHLCMKYLLSGEDIIEDPDNKFHIIHKDCYLEQPLVIPHQLNIMDIDSEPSDKSFEMKPDLIKSRNSSRSNTPICQLNKHIDYVSAQNLMGCGKIITGKKRYFSDINSNNRKIKIICNYNDESDDDESDDDESDDDESDNDESDDDESDNDESDNDESDNDRVKKMHNIIGTISYLIDELKKIASRD